MPDGVSKRSVTLRGHRTSFSIEDVFYKALGVLARKRGMTLAQLVASVDEMDRTGSGLSTALRLHVLQSALDREITADDLS